MGFISLVSEIQFMLISSRRICIRYMEDQKRSNKDEVTREMTTWYCFVGVTWVVVSLQSVQTDVFPPLVQRELPLADETQVRAGTSLKRRGTLNISLLRMFNCSVGLWREKVCDRKTTTRLCSLPGVNNRQVRPCSLSTMNTTVCFLCSLQLSAWGQKKNHWLMKMKRGLTLGWVNPHSSRHGYRIKKKQTA